MHYAHTDGGVSAIRCLEQSVDEPPDSPARAPNRCLSGSYQSLCCQNFRSPRSSQSWQNSQQPRTFEHRLLLFLLTERGLNEDSLTSVCEHCEILGWFAPDVHIDLNSDLLSLTTLGSVKLVVASDALTTAVPFGGQLSSGSAVWFPVKRSSIVIHRNIRFVLPLMVNVEVPVS